MYTYNRLEITDCYSLLRSQLMKCSEYTQYVLKVDLFESNLRNIEFG